MPPGNLDLLVSEVERQMVIALKSFQNMSSGSDPGIKKSILIERQDHGYYLCLKDWCQTLDRANETEWENIVIPEKCQSYLWKLLAFSNSSSSVIHPEYQQARCRDMQGIRARENNLNGNWTEDIWQDTGLRIWATCPESSLVIIQGNSQTIRRVETFSYEISLQLAEAFPTIWMLSEPSCCGLSATKDESELLRQLAIQALQKITYFKASFLIEILCLFKRCKTSHRWFHILERIFQVLPKVYVILNLDILGSRSSLAKNWPDDFQNLICQLGITCSSKLSIMLLSSRPLSSRNQDILVVSVNSKPQQSLQPEPRIRPCGRSLSSIRCLSTLMGTYERVGNQVECSSNEVLGAKRTCHNQILETPNRYDSTSNLHSLESSCGRRQGHNETPEEPISNMLAVTSKYSLPHRNDIAVVIICALPLEANAVLAVFDHHWDIQAFSNERDLNAYSFGRIGRHNVVLVHMPGMGRAAAATVAASCRANFLSIRLALIVGICGAIPFRNRATEILLGDVIISDRLVVYDFGRQFPDKFVRKNDAQDSARKPPEVIRNFLSKMKVPMHHSSLQDSTRSHLKTLVGGDFAPYPGAKNDRLFEPDYRHQHQNPSECLQCCSSESFNGPVCDTARTSTCDALGCDLTRLVGRQRHSHIVNSAEDWLPVIHFGSYASGDTVMKSSEHRDQIAEREQVIAFEMEGAGVWEIFPCIIIKAACDYADSHKSKQWQDYAAVTAAACLKACLEVWPASKSDSNSALIQ